MLSDLVNVSGNVFIGERAHIPLSELEHVESAAYIPVLGTPDARKVPGTGKSSCPSLCDDFGVGKFSLSRQACRVTGRKAHSRQAPTTDHAQICKETHVCLA
mgnify:CR=1 FL=1